MPSNTFRFITSKDHLTHLTDAWMITHWGFPVPWTLGTSPLLSSVLGEGKLKCTAFAARLEGALIFLVFPFLPSPTLWPPLSLHVSDTCRSHK